MTSVDAFSKPRLGSGPSYREKRVLERADLSIVVVHVVVPLSLVLVLLHSGHGGGLSDTLGGGMGASAAGSTVMERNLDRITVVIAVLFSFTTVILALRLQ